MKYSFYDFHANYFISKNQCGSYFHTNQELAFRALRKKFFISIFNPIDFNICHILYDFRYYIQHLEFLF